MLNINLYIRATTIQKIKTARERRFQDKPANRINPPSLFGICAAISTLNICCSYFLFKVTPTTLTALCRGDKILHNPSAHHHHHHHHYYYCGAAHSHIVLHILTMEKKRCLRMFLGTEDEAGAVLRLTDESSHIFR